MCLMINRANRSNSDLNGGDIIRMHIEEIDLCKGNFKNITIVAAEKIKKQKTSCIARVSK